LEGEIFESVKPGLSAYADQPEKVRLSFFPHELILLLLISVAFYQAVQILLIVVQGVKKNVRVLLLAVQTCCSTSVS